MHCHLTQDDNMNPETDVTYPTHNLFSGTENTFLYFFLMFHIFKNYTKLFIEFWQL